MQKKVLKKETGKKQKAKKMPESFILSGRKPCAPTFSWLGKGRCNREKEKGNKIKGFYLFPLVYCLILSPLFAQNSSEIELLELTNTQRQKAGLSDLQMSSQLNQAARIHAEDLVKNQFVSHTGSDGSNPETRAKKAGYNSNYIGENISVGRLNATETIEGWMNSDQHRSNILNPKYTDVGLAYINAPQTQYQHYWVQVFGQKNLISQTPTSNPNPNNTNSQDCQGEKILSALFCSGDSLNSQETELAELINQYRSKKGLSPITLSPSLSRVANRHLQDLQSNVKFYDQSGKDWHFGWSNCPYDANNSNSFPCMWAAPQRLKTAYPGKGYELLCGGEAAISPQDALQCWLKSNPNHDVILNQGAWSNYQWKALGIAINQGYASVWFGQDSDNANKNPSPPQSLPRPGRIW